MFGWIFGKRFSQIEEDTKKGFSAVKDDIDAVGKWIKHLDGRDKQVFEEIAALKTGLSTIKDELAMLRAGAEAERQTGADKQLFKKTRGLDKQTAVEAVQEPVQTAVQTGNFLDILRGLSSNERLVVFTLLNVDEGMKMSYEDLAMMLGKEKSTIRGQINSIKQKSEGLIEDFIEKNGKKRVFIPNFMKEKLAKYAKVRVKRAKKAEV